MKESFISNVSAKLYHVAYVSYQTLLLPENRT